MTLERVEADDPPKAGTMVSFTLREPITVKLGDTFYFGFEHALTAVHFGVRYAEGEGGTLVLKSLDGCARCGGKHEGLEFRKMLSPILTVWDYWALCPDTGEPVLMRRDHLKDDEVAK